MNLKDARLLIVMEKADYRTYFGNSAHSASSSINRPFWSEDQSWLQDWVAQALFEQSFDQPFEPSFEHVVSQSFDPSLAQSLGDLNVADLHILRAAAYWRSQLQDVAIFSMYSATPYTLDTSIGIRLMGSGVLPSDGAIRKSQQNRLVADFCPTHIVFCTPAVAALSWANRNRIPSVALLSDWQEPLGWQQRRHHARLIQQLNCDSIAWIGSHGIPACRILAASGISPRKLIPWEWPQRELPEQYPPKQLRSDRGRCDLLYAGAIGENSGIGDLLLALTHLRQRGTIVHLKLIHLNQLYASDPLMTLETEADSDWLGLRSQIQSLNLSDCVTLIPTQLISTQPISILARQKLLNFMRAADLVVMPSYDSDSLSATASDDLTLQTIYCAMATRTPIVAANHSDFNKHLLHGVNAMIFPAGNAKSMAHRIERVMSQPQLYAQISETLDVALHTLKVPASWTTLVDSWLNSGDKMPAASDNFQRLCNWAFSSGRY